MRYECEWGVWMDVLVWMDEYGWKSIDGWVWMNKTNDCISWFLEINILTIIKHYKKPNNLYLLPTRNEEVFFIFYLDVCRLWTLLINGKAYF